MFLQHRVSTEIGVLSFCLYAGFVLHNFWRIEILSESSFYLTTFTVILFNKFTAKQNSEVNPRDPDCSFIVLTELYNIHRSAFLYFKNYGYDLKKAKQKPVAAVAI